MSLALSTAAQDRKSRLAHLKSLKDKQPDAAERQESVHRDDDSAGQLKRKNSGGDNDEGGDAETESDQTSKYISGRNYDTNTKGPKLGFETAPSAGKETLEQRALALTEASTDEIRKNEAQDKPLDLSSLQPKKPNWDLKRDLNRKLDMLNPRTQAAIGRLVRERIASAKQQQAEQRATTRHEADGSGNGPGETADGEQGGEAIGLDGTSLVEATKEREREQERERKEQDELRREREYGDE